MAQLTRILGVDPGSRLTGFGCIEVNGSSLRHLAHGTLKLSGYERADSVSFERRLQVLFESLCGVIDQWKPQVMVVEKVFFAKNALSALKLGHARGVILLCGALKGIKIYEYTATQVKSSITGYGQADKDQVARMIPKILENFFVGNRFHTPDASDALALATAHAMLRRSIDVRANC